MAIGMGTALLGGSILNGVMGAKSAKKAAGASANAAREAAQMIMDAANEAADLQGTAYKDAGKSSSDALGQSGTILTDASNKALGHGVEGLTQSRDALLSGNTNALAAYQGAGDAMLGENRAAYDTTTGLFRPYADAGQNALGALSFELGLGARPEGYAGHEGSAGYRFALNEANKGIEASAATRGGLMSGATLKALSDNTVGMAQQDYNGFLDRLTGQVDMGYNASGQLATSANALATGNNQVHSMLGTAGANAAQNAGQIGSDYFSGLAGLYSGNALDIGNINSNVLLGQTDAINKGNTAAADAKASAVQTAASAQSGATIAAGNAQSAGIMGQQNALNGMFGNLAGVASAGVGLNAQSKGQYGWNW